MFVGKKVPVWGRSIYLKVENGVSPITHNDADVLMVYMREQCAILKWCMDNEFFPNEDNSI